MQNLQEIIAKAMGWEIESMEVTEEFIEDWDLDQKKSEDDPDSEYLPNHPLISKGNLIALVGIVIVAVLLYKSTPDTERVIVDPIETIEEAAEQISQIFLAGIEIK